MRVMSFRQGPGGSYKRIALEGDEELRGAGNGIDDHDETSEDTRATWSQNDSDPTPGEIPAGLFDPP